MLNTAYTTEPAPRCLVGLLSLAAAIFLTSTVARWLAGCAQELTSALEHDTAPTSLPPSGLTLNLNHNSVAK